MMKLVYVLKQNLVIF